MTFKNLIMRNSIQKFILILGIALTGTILFSSCDKDDTSNPSMTNEEYFTNNALNRDFLVHLATDNGTDITAQFAGFTFRLTKTASLSGNISASNDILTENGTWSIDAAYDKITFNFPTSTISSLAFFNKQWQFTSRNSALIELSAANGETDVLHFQRE